MKILWNVFMEDKAPAHDHSSTFEPQNYNTLLFKLYSENISLQNELKIQQLKNRDLIINQEICIKTLQQLHEENKKLKSEKQKISSLKKRTPPKKTKFKTSNPIQQVAPSNSSLSTPQNTPRQTQRSLNYTTQSITTTAALSISVLFEPYSTPTPTPSNLHK